MSPTSTTDQLGPRRFRTRTREARASAQALEGRGGVVVPASQSVEDPSLRVVVGCGDEKSAGVPVHVVHEDPEGIVDGHPVPDEAPGAP